MWNDTYMTDVSTCNDPLKTHSGSRNDVWPVSSFSSLCVATSAALGRHVASSARKRRVRKHIWRLQNVREKVRMCVLGGGCCPPVWLMGGNAIMVLQQKGPAQSLPVSGSRLPGLIRTPLWCNRTKTKSSNYTVFDRQQANEGWISARQSTSETFADTLRCINVAAGPRWGFISLPSLGSQWRSHHWSQLIFHLKTQQLI